MVTSASPLARSPLHAWHIAHGVHMETQDGWAVPARYRGVDEELAAARAAVGLADLSAFGKVRLLGPGVGEFTRERLAGTAAVNNRGVAVAAIPEPALICRPAAEQLLLVASSPRPAGLQDVLRQIPAEWSLLQSDASSALALFDLLGPKIEDVLRRLTGVDVRPSFLSEGTCAETSLAGVHALLIRAPQQATPSLAVAVAWDVAEYVWERLLDAGHGLGLVPIGHDAWRRLIFGS